MVLLGIIGEYVGRIYICMNNAPQYVIREVAMYLNISSIINRYATKKLVGLMSAGLLIKYSVILSLILLPILRKIFCFIVLYFAKTTSYPFSNSLIKAPTSSIGVCPSSSYHAMVLRTQLKTWCKK